MMAEKGETKILTIIATFIIFIMIVFSGCISPSDFEIPPESPSKHPSYPIISADNIGEGHIIWNAYSSKEYHVMYSMVSRNGTKMNNRILINKNLRYPKFIKDTNEDFHLFFNDGTERYTYLKINKKGELLINKIIDETKTYSEIIWAEHFDVTIDQKDNLYLLWLTQNNTIGYIELSNKGEVKNFQDLGEFLPNITDLKMKEYSSFHITIDKYGVIWTTWASGGNTFNTNTNIIGGFDKNLSGNTIKTDSVGNIYILSGNYVKKLDNNKTLLFKEKLNNISVISGYPVIKSDDGNYLYLGNLGFMDLENNLHIVKHEVETKVWESGRYLKEYDFHTIYYSKIASNGTILIDKMVIDTDGEPSWETGEYTTQLIIIFLLIAIPIAIVILIIVLKLLKKQNKKDHSK